MYTIHPCRLDCQLGPHLDGGVGLDGGPGGRRRGLGLEGLRLHVTAPGPLGLLLPVGDVLTIVNGRISHDLSDGLANRGAIL